MPERRDWRTVGRREAAKILGVTVSAVARFEADGDLSGTKNSHGQARYPRESVEELRVARMMTRATPTLELDFTDEGDYLLRRVVTEDPVEDGIERRWREERALRERELDLKERELREKKRTFEMISKQLPRVVAALERSSWSSVAQTVVEAIPEEQRKTILAEVAGLFGGQK